MRSMVTLSALTVLALLGEGCVVVGETCNPRNCSSGCCSTAGQCVGGSAANACGNGGNACSVCPGTFVCSLGTCQPGSSAGGGFGGGGGGGGGSTGGGGGSSTLSGDVIFTWNFGGRSCASETAVRNVRVAIPGQALMNAGLFPCNTGGTDGIRLLNFAAGSYGYTLEALSATGVVLYQAAGNFTINGNATVNATLTAVDVLGSAWVSWSFPPNTSSSAPNCAQAGVMNVTAVIDSGAPLTLTCTQGFGASVRIDNLTTGNHTVVLEGADGNGFIYYRKTGPLVAQAGTPAQNAYLFDWAVGSLPVKWTFNNGTTIVNCAQAGVINMNVNLRDSTGTLVYGTNGADVPCTNASAQQGTVFPFLSAGTYELFLQAYGTGSVLYHTNLTVPPQVSVTAGEFPLIDNPNITIAQLLTL